MSESLRERVQSLTRKIIGPSAFAALTLASCLPGNDVAQQRPPDNSNPAVPSTPGEVSATTAPTEALPTPPELVATETPPTPESPTSVEAPVNQQSTLEQSLPHPPLESTDLPRNNGLKPGEMGWTELHTIDEEFLTTLLYRDLTVTTYPSRSDEELLATFSNLNDPTHLLAIGSTIPEGVTSLNEEGSFDYATTNGTQVKLEVENVQGGKLVTMVVERIYHDAYVVAEGVTAVIDLRKGSGQ